MRQRTTSAEEKLWPYLRNRKFKGLKFCRQHPIDRFIVDYICIEKQLVIEVDGAIHNTSEQKKYDKNRTVVLGEYGLTVIRFTNNEILNDVFKVLKEIEKYI